MNPYIAVAVAAFVFFSGWEVRTWYDGAQETARLAAEAKTRDRLEELAGEVATRTEKAIQGIRIENKTITAEVQREIVEKPVYRDCIIPADGVRLVNKARAAAGEPDAAMRAGQTAR